MSGARSRGSIMSRLGRLATTRAARRTWLATLLGLYLLSGLTFVAADQQGVVVVLGRARPSPLSPGLHWRWPPPISRVIKLRTQETRRLTVGFDAPEQVLGRSAAPGRAQFLTGDRNIVLVRLTVQYAVVDPLAYLFATREPEQLLRTTVERALAEVASRLQVDDLLTTEKVGVQQSVQSITQELVERYGCGVTILGANLEQVAPPQEVLEAFNDVASAREDRDRIVREAQSYANQILPVARGEGAQLRSRAESDRERKVQSARGQAAHFTALAAEHAKAPRTTAARLYLETMDQVLPGVDLTVLDAEAGTVDLDFLRPLP